MQAVTCMQASTTPHSIAPGSAAERLLDAAVTVFAREGISSATTREIAKEAGVNEVTLFRNFQTKQGLLAAVLERAFRPIDESTTTGPSGRGTLEHAVREFARADFDRKSRNIALMRVLVGESHRLGDHETEVLSRIFRPWKERLAARLREARDQGEIRDDVNPVMIVDQLVAMIFVGVLRAEKLCAQDYDSEGYLKGCVDLVLRGIAVEKQVKKSRK